jgi:hypothetical protein
MFIVLMMALFFFVRYLVEEMKQALNQLYNAVATGCGLET